MSHRSVNHNHPLSYGREWRRAIFFFNSTFNFIYNFNTYTTYSYCTNITCILTFTLVTLLIHALLNSTVLKGLKEIQNYLEYGGEHSEFSRLAASCSISLMQLGIGHLCWCSNVSLLAGYIWCGHTGQNKPSTPEEVERLERI